MNNLAQIQTDLKTTLGTNLDATTITNARDFIIRAWNEDWKMYLAANSLTDTTANRNNFIALHWLEVLRNAYMRGSDIANKENVPAASTIT